MSKGREQFIWLGNCDYGVIFRISTPSRTMRRECLWIETGLVFFFLSEHGSERAGEGGNQTELALPPLILVTKIWK